MRRTTVRLPEDLKSRAEAHARERGISLGSLVRRSLERALAEPRDASAEPFLDDAAIWDGDAPSDLAANHDRYLYDDEEPAAAQDAGR